MMDIFDGAYDENNENVRDPFLGDQELNFDLPNIENLGYLSSPFKSYGKIVKRYSSTSLLHCENQPPKRSSNFLSARGRTASLSLQKSRSSTPSIHPRSLTHKHSCGLDKLLQSAPSEEIDIKSDDLLPKASFLDENLNDQKILNRERFDVFVLSSHGFSSIDVCEFSWGNANKPSVQYLEQLKEDREQKGERFIKKEFNRSPRDSSSFNGAPQSNGQWIVEKILDVRIRTIDTRKGRRQIREMLFKWKDWAYDYCTWEQESRENQIEELMYQFMERQKMQALIQKKLKANKKLPQKYLARPAEKITYWPSFYHCHKWEDKLNQIASRHGQARIFVENWVDNVSQPSDFKFLLKNIKTPAVEASFEPFLVKQDLICQCADNFCDRNTECCPKNFGMSFAYDVETGDKLSPIFKPNLHWVVECTDSCACDRYCPNRVVQRGRTIPIVIFRTPDRGWSVRTLANIQRRSFVMEYVGMVMTIKEATDGNIPTTYQFLMDGGGGKSAFYLLDAAHCGNEARFVNHSCSPNLVVRVVFADRFDYRFHRIAFFAKKDIEAGTELTIDYSAINDNSKKGRKCMCGSSNCRGWYF